MKQNQIAIPQTVRAKALLAIAGYEYSNAGGAAKINGRPFSEHRDAVRACLIGAGFSRLKTARIIFELGGGAKQLFFYSAINFCKNFLKKGMR